MNNLKKYMNGLPKMMVNFLINNYRTIIQNVHLFKS